MLLQRYESILNEFPEYRLLKALMLYVPPILIVVGTLGNMFSFIILRRRAMAKVSSYLYLASLAIADSLVLYIGLLRLWLGELTGTDFHDSSNWVCKLTISFGYMASDLSVWLIIAVTVERYIVVCFPLRASRLISTARAKRVVGLLVLLMLALNLHFFWTVEIVQRPVDGANVSNCEAAPLHERLVHDVWPWVDACIYSFVPFIVVLVLNILIIYEVVEARRHRQHMQNSTPTHNYHHSLQQPVTRGTGRQTQVCSRQSRRSTGPGDGTKLTIMLLTVSFTFLLTTLPMNVSLIVTAFWHHNSSLRQTTQLKLAKTVAELLMYVNHSINFFLYCATGQKFRQEILLMLSCRTDPSYAPCTSLHTTEDSKVLAPPHRNGQQHSLRTPQRHMLLAKADEDVGSLNGESIPLRAV